MNSSNYLNNLIYKKSGSIPDILCDDIIEKYEKNKELHYAGVTMGGSNKNIKDTTDMIIPKKNKDWHDVEEYLYEELNRNLKIYLNNLTFENGSFLEKHKGSHFLTIDNFLLQKYEKNKGKYTYHNDHFMLINFMILLLHLLRKLVLDLMNNQILGV